MNVYSRTYHNNGDITEIVKTDDGRTGIWSPIKQQWVSVYGNGFNAGFRMEILNSCNLTTEGKKLVKRWKKFTETADR